MRKVDCGTVGSHASSGAVLTLRRCNDPRPLARLERSEPGHQGNVMTAKGRKKLRHERLIRHVLGEKHGRDASWICPGHGATNKRWSLCSSHGCKGVRSEKNVSDPIKEAQGPVEAKPRAA